MSAETLLTAIALVFVIEGLLYALCPNMLHKLLEMASTMPAEHIRMMGLLVASIGVFFVWLVQTFM